MIYLVTRSPNDRLPCYNSFIIVALTRCNPNSKGDFFMKGFSKLTQEALGYYVYGLINPFTGKIFYVGKASANNRAFDHLKGNSTETEKLKTIQNIRERGKEPKVEILRYGLKDAETAFEVEASIIDAIGIENLTNAVRGHGIEHGRLTLEEVERLYSSEPVNIEDIEERYMMFFLTQTYRTTMSEVELYDATRQAWYDVSKETRTKNDEHKLPYEIALSIYDSVVVRVYSIEDWYEAGKTFTTNENIRYHPDSFEDRWEFVGRLLEEHPLLGKKLLKNGIPLKAYQKGYGYIN